MQVDAGFEIGFMVSVVVRRPTPTEAKQGTQDVWAPCGGMRHPYALCLEQAIVGWEVIPQRLVWEESNLQCCQAWVGVLPSKRLLRASMFHCRCFTVR